MPTRSSCARATRSASLRSRLRTTRWASMTFSRVVRCGNRLNCWNTMPTSARTALMSLLLWARRLPSTKISPPLGVSRWLMQRSTVDLPEPLGPMITVTCPLGTLRLTPSTARSGPNCLTRSLMTIMSLTGAAIFTPARFQPFHAQRKQNGHAQIDKSQRVIRFWITKRGGGIQPRLLCDVGHAQDRDQRRILEHGDKVVAQRRQDAPDGLRQDHVAHGLEIAHAQAARGFHLPAADRL